jgi:prepilin-type processing-associated H-X9-DG protein
MYAEKNDGGFPDRDGEAGLEQLRDAMWDEAYLMNSPYLMNCPGVRARPELPISYDYRAGYRIDSDKDIGIVMDRATNHKNYGNIGFVDGRVWGFPGKDWRRNADKESGEQGANQAEPTQ